MVYYCETEDIAQAMQDSYIHRLQNCTGKEYNGYVQFLNKQMKNITLFAEFSISCVLLLFYFCFIQIERMIVPV